MTRSSSVSSATLEGIAALGAYAPAGRGQASRHVYDALREAIVRCRLPPGTALNEAAVAQQFAVSRTPVREAFKALCGDGLIDIAPQRGTFVSRLDRADLSDALFVREAIECAAVRLAAAAPAGQRRSLMGFVERQREALQAGDMDAALAADEGFHEGIVRLAGHGSAWAVVLHARTRLERLRRLANQAIHGSEEAVVHHGKVARAVARGDADAAERLLRAHIRQVSGFIARLGEVFPQYIA